MAERENERQRKRFQPELKYGLLNLRSKYEIGLEVDGVGWQSDFREYMLRVENKHTNMELSDFRLDVDVPGGVVKARIYDQAGCDDLRILESDDIGHIVKKESGIAIKQFTWLSNNIKASAVRLFPKSHFDIKLIVKLVPVAEPEGFFGVDYSHPDVRGNAIHKNESFKIVPLEGSLKNFKIDTDNPIVGKHTRSLQCIPSRPLVFKKDGRIIPKE